MADLALRSSLTPAQRPVRFDEGRLDAGKLAPVPVPLPSDRDVLLGPPTQDEVEHLARGVVSAVVTADGLTELQDILIRAVFDAMTGHEVVPAKVTPIEPAEFAEGLAHRNEAFRTRIVQVMLLAELILAPLPKEVSDRVEAFSHELGIDEGMLRVARRYAEGSLGLAALDFERNGYTATWHAEDAAYLHTSEALHGAWAQSVRDPGLAARWAALGDLPPGTLGRQVHEFYRARGFAFPGLPGSAPPLLAQHDWVHVVADYGTTVEAELEVFGFIARANDDPRAFSLLAMVISLFETGYLRAGAGLFEHSPGHLARQGMAVRLADAMRRGALCTGSVDFLTIDWFSLADLPLDEVRERFGVVAKGPAALAVGSVGPLDPAGISEFQRAAGGRLAADSPDGAPA